MCIYSALYSTNDNSIDNKDFSGSLQAETRAADHAHTCIQTKYTAYLYIADNDLNNYKLINL